MKRRVDHNYPLLLDRPFFSPGRWKCMVKALGLLISSIVVVGATGAVVPVYASPLDERTDGSDVVNEADPLVHVVSEASSEMDITECMAGYVFQRDGHFYGITTTDCGPTGTVVSKLDKQGQKQRVGEVIAHDKANSSLAVIQFDDHVRQGRIYQLISRDKYPRPVVNTIDYFGSGSHNFDNSVILSYPKDNGEGVSTFTFTCEPRFAIQGSPLLVEQTTMVGMYTSAWPRLSPVALCRGVTASYIEDFSQQGNWVQ